MNLDRWMSLMQRLGLAGHRAMFEQPVAACAEPQHPGRPCRRWQELLGD